MVEKDTYYEEYKISIETYEHDMYIYIYIYIEREREI